jgi:hypothetical protein
VGVWVSEILLQQTQVSCVVTYFNKWVAFHLFVLMLRQLVVACECLKLTACQGSSFSVTHLQVDCPMTHCGQVICLSSF